MPQSSMTPTDNVLLGPEDIRVAVTTIVEFIQTHLKGRKVLLVPILDGALPLYTDIMLELRKNPTLGLDYYSISYGRYGNKEKPGVGRMRRGFQAENGLWAEYTVVVIDDIYDVGVTARKVIDDIVHSGVKKQQVVYVSLLNKHFSGAFSINGIPAFSFKFMAKGWAYGYGLDDENYKGRLFDRVYIR